MHKLALVGVLVAGVGVASAAPKVTLSFATPTVKGALDATVVGKVLTAGKRKLLACYKDLWPGERNASKATFVKFLIGKDGKATAPATKPSDPLDTCLLTTTTKLSFPRPKDGAAVEVLVLLTYVRKE